MRRMSGKWKSRPEAVEGALYAFVAITMYGDQDLLEER